MWNIKTKQEYAKQNKNVPKADAGQPLSEGKCSGGRAERIKMCDGQQCGGGWKQELWW